MAKDDVEDDGANWKKSRRLAVQRGRNCVIERSVHDLKTRRIFWTI